MPRIRSPRRARQVIDGAAVAIAASPDVWSAVVDGVRVQLGRAPLPEPVRSPQGHQFIQTEVNGLPAAYPVQHVQPLEGGGMNSVLRSAELFSGRDLAIRRHLPAASAVEEAHRRARDEIVRERLSTLPRHPVIPRFWATGRVDGERCEVFDFAPGTSLTSFVPKNGLTLAGLLKFALHAARGLWHLHQRGLVHGDVKPENFCVGERRLPDGSTALQVSLIDFDIVSTPDEQIRQYLLGNGLEGTLPYMPPENFRQVAPEDPEDAARMIYSKDVFALGLTLARVVTGRFPKAFYTSMGSLLEKKIAGVQVDLELPERLPAPLLQLIRSMSEVDWYLRPSLPDVMSTVRQLLKETPAEKLREVIVAPRAPESGLHRAVTAEKPTDFVGPYSVVNRAFLPRPPGDDQRLPLAELRDPFGRKLIGVPFVFASKDEELAFYDERTQLLKELNAVRLKHPELFPGSFRDLVREEKEGVFLVWILRPLLEGALDLNQYLTTARPKAPIKERLAILRRAAEALAVLEAADIALPRLTPEILFFVPQPAEPANPSLTRAALTRPIKRLFDVPSRDPSVFYRQELMGTSGARRGAAARKNRTVTDLLDIAEQIGVFRDLGPADGNYLLQIAGTDTWRERVDILTWVEASVR